VLTQAGDPPGETLGATLTLTYSRSQWSTAARPGGSVTDWSGSFNGTAIVNGRFGCDECYSGIWQAKRRKSRRLKILMAVVARPLGLAQPRPASQIRNIPAFGAM
jgi:hypothetical protein